MSDLVFTTERIGPKRSATPEGYLFCQDVPIARIGTMLYAPDDDPVKDIVNPRNQPVRVERDADTLFNDVTISSFAGKPITNDHPPKTMVGPTNYKVFSVGTTLNVRRGVGRDSDVLLADLLIMDETAIKDVMSGLDEISCGYDADIKEMGEAHGQQMNIIGNHVALVSEGRCGPRCAIGDSSSGKSTGRAGPNTSKDTKMATKKASLLDRLMKAFKDGDIPEAVMKDMMDEPTAGEGEGGMEGGKGDIHIHNYGQGGKSGEAAKEEQVTDEVGARLDKLEAGHGQIMESLKQLLAKLGDTHGEVKDGESDKEIKDEDMEGEMEEGADSKSVKDSVSMADSFQRTCALAEIIVPGIRLPVFDSKAAPRKTFDSICKLRREALEMGNSQPATRALIEDALGGKKLHLDRMHCDSIRHLFNAVGGTAKTLTNHQQYSHRDSQYVEVTGKGGIQDISDLQEAWNRRNKGN